jgi:hypothetical protein
VLEAGGGVHARLAESAVDDAELHAGDFSKRVVKRQ